MTSAPDIPRRSRRLFALAGLAVLALCAFGPGLSGELLNWDDDRFVTDNATIQRVSWNNIVEIFSKPHQQAYHPLHLSAYMLQYSLWGRWALGYKLVSLALYLLAAWLLLRLLLRLGHGYWAAAAGVALFVVHPLHVEAVSWISAQKEPLSLIFMLLALLSYLRAGEPWRKSGHYVASLLLFGAALLTKTSTIVLPLLIIAVDLLYQRRPIKEALLRAAPLLALAGAVGLYVKTLWTASAMTRAAAPQLGAKLSLVFSTLGHYFAKLVAPLDLSPVYAISAPARPGSALLGVVATLALVALALRLSSKGARLAVAWLLLSLLPVCNIVPVYFYVQDRYAFIASAALAIGLTTLIDALRDKGAKPRRVAFLASGCVVVALTIGSALTARHWRSNEQLWRHAARVQPQSYFAHLGLAHTYRASRQLAQAKESYRRAAALRPGQATAQLALCLVDVATRVPPAQRAQRTAQLQKILQKSWSERAALQRLSAKLQRAGALACARVTEQRAFALATPSALEALRAASRWTLAGDGAQALVVLARVGAQPPRRLVSAYFEIRAQALALLGREDEARRAFARFRKAAPIGDDKIRQSAARLRKLGRRELATFYERQLGQR